MKASKDDHLMSIASTVAIASGAYDRTAPEDVSKFDGEVAFFLSDEFHEPGMAEPTRMMGFGYIIKKKDKPIFKVVQTFHITTSQCDKFIATIMARICTRV